MKYISAVPVTLVYMRFNLIKKIKTKGYNEQERQYLWPSVYGSKAVTKNTKGQFFTFNRQLRRGKYAPFF